MPTKKPPTKAKAGKTQAASKARRLKSDPLAELDQQISEVIKEISRLRGNATVLPLFLNKASINNKTVDDVFEELRSKYGSPGSHERLDLILESSGGNIDAAYNIGLLLRRYATKELNVLVPRWAKSAATVIACAGDKVWFTPVAEIGPVDPQIMMFNPLEERLEEFSPLDIDSTLDLIREEFKNGHKDLAQGLLQRLQFPLTLGSIKKSLDVGSIYITRLLKSRMLKGDNGKAANVAKCLVHDYANHGFCIEVDEASQIGLTCELLPDNQVDALWRLRKLMNQKQEIERQKKSKEMQEVLKNLPPELLKQLPDLLKRGGADNGTKPT
ncbi:MAG TPA: hypothetical protein VJT15_02565 [Pyrinomonadaceae bacterium]|nr:hypothetical protein [Pyrinomonadaceae bacterium]